MQYSLKAVVLISTLKRVVSCESGCRSVMTASLGTELGDAGMAGNCFLWWHGFSIIPIRMCDNVKVYCSNRASRSISTGQTSRHLPQPTQDMMPRVGPKPRYLC